MRGFSSTFVFRFLILLLTWQLVPGLNEVAENVWHLAREGHGAHALADAEHSPDDEEHGCSGVFHLCPCHASSPGVATRAARLPLGSLVDERPATESFRRFEPPRSRLDRPPRIG